jgi:hypothetical protein
MLRRFGSESIAPGPYQHEIESPGNPDALSNRGFK